MGDKRGKGRRMRWGIRGIRGRGDRRSNTRLLR